MSSDKRQGTDPTSSESLRRRAEARLRARRSELSSLSEADVRVLVFELQAHQAELELQSEELRESQVALANARDELASIYEFAPVGYVMVDLDGVVRRANLFASTLLGVPRERLVGAPFAQFVAPESRPLWGIHHCSVLAAATAETCEVEMSREDHRRVVARLDSIAAHDGSQRITGCRVAFTDVTPRVEAEEALRQANRRLEERVAEGTSELQRKVEETTLLAEAIAHLGEGVLITDDELDWPGPRIIFVNEAMLEITGYSEQEMLGQTPRMLQGPKTSRAALGRLKRALRERKSVRTDIVNYRKDRTPYDAEVFVAPLLDGNGRCRHYVSVHRDRSERKRLERQRLEAIRAAQHAEEVERRALAQDLHDSIGQLLALARMKLPELCEPNADRSLKHKVGELTSLIEDADRRTRTLMLRLSPPSLHTLGLAAAAEELVEDMQQHYGLRVEVATDGSARSLTSEVQQILFRGLRELLINVARHSDTAAASVSIARRGAGLRVVVEDVGRGFDPSRLSTGFGLVSLRERLSRIGGELVIVSAPSAGTRVEMRVPHADIPSKEEGA